MVRPATATPSLWNIVQTPGARPDDLMWST